MTADPKPAARIVDPRAGSEKVRREGRCRVCGCDDDWIAHPLNGHHLIPRSQGGDDVDANIVPLCGSGTTGCHGLVTARDPLALRRLREQLRLDEIAYCVAKVGAVRLDRRYPHERRPT